MYHGRRDLRPPGCRSGYPHLRRALLTTYSLLVSSSPSRSAPVALSGQNLAGRVYVFTSPDTSVLHVYFWLDKATTTVPTHVENYPPMDFVGTAADNTAYPWDLSSVAEGAHTITARLMLTGGATVMTTASFSTRHRPAAPTNLTAKAGDRTVSLAWSKSVTTNLTGYNVYRNGTKITPVPIAGTTYQDTGLTDGTTYTYTVTAVNGAGESAPSNQAVATPEPLLPSAPLNLGATPGNTQVALAWTTPTTPNGTITGYHVYRDGLSVTTTSGTGTTYTNTGLVNGTPYTFTVAAVTSSGEGPLSNSATATPAAAATAPSAPTLNSATSGDSIVQLAWSVPTSNGGSSITGYNLYRSTSSGTETLRSNLGNVLVYTDSGTNGTVYYYKVSAVNSAGEGPLSNEKSAQPTGGSQPGCTTTVSGLDATGGTDVTSAFQSFFGSNKVVCLQPNATYRLNGGLTLNGMSNLTIEGNGATLTMSGYARPIVTMYGSNGITINNMNVRGDNSGAGTGNAYQPNGQEFSHGFSVRGSSNIDIGHCHVSYVWGDDVFIGSQSSFSNWCDTVNIHDNLLELNGRVGVVINAGRNITVQNNTISQIAMFTFDLEPDDPAEGASNVKLINNTCGAYGLSNRLAAFWIGMVGSTDPTGSLNGILVDGNTVTGNTGGYGGTQLGLTIYAYAKTVQKQNITITNNVCTRPAGDQYPGAVAYFKNINNITFQHNTQPVTSGAHLVVTSGCTGTVITSPNP